MTVPPVLPSPQQLRYRNKIVFTFQPALDDAGRKDLARYHPASPPPASFYAWEVRSHLEIHECALIEPIAVRILHRLRDIALKQA